MTDINKTKDGAPSNLAYLNSYSRGYHVALQGAQEDLWLVFCDFLGSEYAVTTRQALEALRLRLKGMSEPLTAVPIDPATAAMLTDHVLTTEDIKNLTLAETF